MLAKQPSSGGRLHQWLMPTGAPPPPEPPQDPGPSEGDEDYILPAKISSAEFTTGTQTPVYACPVKLK